MSMNYNLFSGVSGSSGSFNWISDWNSIKSGTYGRLMKAYYGDSGHTASSSKSDSASKAKTNNVLDQILEEKKHPTVSQEVQDANSKLSSGISSLKNSVSALQNEDTFKDSEDGTTSAADNAASAMKNFVSQYNSVVGAAKKSTLSRQTSHIASMMKTTDAYKKQLEEIGVTLNKDGTLQFNEGKFKSADLSKVQDLFSRDNVMSYGSTVNARLGFASASSAAVQSTEKEEDTKEPDAVTYEGAAALKGNIADLTSDDLYKKVTGKDGSEQYDTDRIFDAVKKFAGNYNSMLDTARFSVNSGVSSNLAWIMEKTSQNKDALGKLGITVGKDGKLTVDEDAFKKSDMSDVEKFFKKYGPSIANQVSLVDYYLTTQAGVSSNYTEDGAYYAQGSYRFDTAG